MSVDHAAQAQERADMEAEIISELPTVMADKLRAMIRIGRAVEPVEQEGSGEPLLELP